ncbi:MAG: acetyl-CoA hydrolase/transferase family protein [Luteibaculaceae bacterium]
MRLVTAQEALQLVQSNQRVFVQGSAATPQHLIRNLVKEHERLRNVELVSVSTFGDFEPALEQYKESFFINSLFVSANVRKAVNSPYGDYIPVFLSEINLLFERNILPLDVALIHVSPPDKHGFCSLGVSVDVARSAVKNAKRVIAQINPKMPRTHGDGIIHINDIDFCVEANDDLPEVDYSAKISDTEHQIAKHIANIIPDRATLQMGIGSIPDAVLLQLGNHKDLGVHTEMFSNGVVELLKKGAITNKYKKKHRGKIVTSFAIGNRALYDFIDDNPQFAFLEASYVNDGAIIRQNPKAVAINSAIEIDITGQVCADSIGTYQFSGVGGQMDFIRGAALSEDGIPIIAIGSITHKGVSKIVPTLQSGGNVVTTRAHMHYVATEYGIINLFGKNLRQRAEALRDIAHPSQREFLDKAITERFGTKYKSL